MELFLVVIVLAIVVRWVDLTVEFYNNGFKHLFEGNNYRLCDDMFCFS